jgi:vacuolar-type H+-ATPase catalytic subunit A/Vma1
VQQPHADAFDTYCVPGVSHPLSLSLKPGILMSILQMIKLRLREVENLTQVFTSRKRGARNGTKFLLT